MVLSSDLSTPCPAIGSLPFATVRGFQLSVQAASVQLLEPLFGVSSMFTYTAMPLQSTRKSLLATLAPPEVAVLLVVVPMLVAGVLVPLGTAVLLVVVPPVLVPG